jgi:hypothetical protein
VMVFEGYFGQPIVQRVSLWRGRASHMGCYMVGKVLQGGCYRNKEPAQGRAKCGPGGSHNATHQGPYHA